MALSRNRTNGIGLAAQFFLDAHALIVFLDALTTAIGLFAAVSVPYLITWFNTHALVTAQTMAFVTWLVGRAM